MPQALDTSLIEAMCNIHELAPLPNLLSPIPKKELQKPALEWIMKRVSNDNGLVELMTDSDKEKRGSDWIDIDNARMLRT